MSTLPPKTYTVSKFPIKLPLEIFLEIVKDNSNIHIEPQNTLNNKNNLENKTKKNKDGGLTFPTSKHAT